MDNLDLSRLLMEYLQKHARGRENAVNRDTVLDYLRLFDRGLHDRRFRDLYSRQPVCSCEKGLYIPVTPEDVEMFQNYLRAKAVPLLTRHKTVLTYYPHLAPAHGEQMELFG